MMDKDIIKIVKDTDGSEYFNYAVSDPGMANVLNMEGWMKVGDWICQYTPEGFKIILDGDFAKVEQVKTINNNYKDETFLVHVEQEIRDRAMENTWTAFQDNNKPDDFDEDGRKRWRVWIEGYSEPLYGEIDEDCTNFLACVNRVRAEAQKKNIWGTWKYKSKFSPPLKFENQWAYSYTRYTDNLCGLYKQEFHYVAPYSCTPNPSYMCPTSPHFASYPSVNNAFLNHTPHGNWSADGTPDGDGYGYFADAFDANGLLVATFNGTGWDIFY